MSFGRMLAALSGSSSLSVSGAAAGAATTTTATSTAPSSSSTSTADSADSVKVVCEDNPSSIQPWTGIDLSDPSSLFSLELHTYAWVACGIAAGLATIISLVLVYKHLRSFHKPLQQVHIVRILLIVPVYAIISWFSFRYYTRAVYYNVIRDCYESLVVYSFFSLIMQFLGDTLHVQRLALASKPRRMPFPIPFCCLGYYDPTTPTFLRRMRTLVLQYVVVRPLMTAVAVVSQLLSKFCAESMSPMYGHFWYMALNTTSVSAAMYGLIVIYFTIKDDIAEYKPLPKFLSIKIVILFTLWQGMILSVLAHYNVIHGAQFWTRTNVANGIQSMLVCLEMLAASIYHHWSFSATEYELVEDEERLVAGRSQARTSVWRALGRCLNPMDLARDMYHSGQHLVYEAKGAAAARGTLGLGGKKKAAETDQSGRTLAGDRQTVEEEEASNSAAGEALFNAQMRG